MRRILSAAVLAAVVAGVSFVGSSPSARAQDKPASTQPDAGSTQVPVKAVVLFSSGVGYFEHYGVVNGDGTTELRFKTQQINDILKSLLLQDLDGGKVSAITYPSQDPLSKTLKSFQVDITSNPSMGDLLNQLRGAKITLTTSGSKDLPAQKLSGTVLGVESKTLQIKDTQTIEIKVLNLLTGATLHAIPLDTVEELSLDDPQLQAELDKALAALAQARDQDKKPVSIHFTGQGERHVKIGYVVETPIWKVSYRLVLSSPNEPNPSTQPAGEKPAFHDGKLLGWAIVENQTDNDWNDVQLSLVSGRPISFIQDLYQPLYVPRPVVQPELFASLRPQTYDAGMDEAGKVDVEKTAEADEAQNGRAMAVASGVPRAEYARSGKMLQQAQDMVEDRKSMDATASIASVASAAKIGELFEYTVGNVSLPRQRSAMIPIITDPVQVERLSIYNQSVLARNPLNGARIKNTTGKHLLAGPITVLDHDSYAGDASIDNVPPGQERLISYGVDLEMLIDATKNTQTSSIMSGKIVKGTLIVTYKQVSTQEYTANNKGDNDKALIIEHPLHQGWSLVDSAKPIETTDSLYRFRIGVPAGKTASLTVHKEHVDGQEMAILPTDLGTITRFSQTGEIPKDVRDALIKAIGLRQAQVDTDRQIQERTQRIAEITAEQGRIRENMKNVDRGGQYFNRLQTKLNDQETELEKLQSEIDDLRKTEIQQRKDLEDYLNNLNVG